MLAPWGKKSYDKPVLWVLNLVTQSCLTLWGKPRWLHFADKVKAICQVKAMVFPVVMYGCESWTIMKAEHHNESWITDAFKLWCWRIFLKVTCTVRGSKQSILKEINPEYSLKGLMLKLKLQYFGHWCEGRFIGKDPNAGKNWGQEEEGVTDEMVGWNLWLNGHEFEQIPGDSEGWRSLVCCHPWGHKQSDMTEQLNNNKFLHFLPF